MNKLAGRILLALLLYFTLITNSFAEDKDFLTLGAGAFEFIHPDDAEPAGFVSYRFAPRLFADTFGPIFRGIGPMVGVMANTDGGVFGYGDVFLDIRPTDNLVIWPSAGIGGYRLGDSKPLGGTFQFHLEVFVGYSFAERHMLGISYQHVSNAGIQDINPTADSLYLSYSIALPPLF